MRPAAPSVLLLVALLLSFVSGCSTRHDKILANKRLLRGGLGATTSLVLLPDRDTYVGTSKAIQGHPIPVGADGILDIRAFFSASSWTLVPSGVADTSVVAIAVVIETDSLADRPSNAIVEMSENQGPFDSTYAYGDPLGPRAGTALATANSSDLGALRFVFGSAQYARLVRWAARPDSFPGLALLGSTLNGLVFLDEARAFLRVIYNNQSTGYDSVTTKLTRHFALRSALTPTPTGTETALTLGGNYDTGLLFHFPPVDVPQGSTVNEATLRLRLDPAQVPFASGDAVEITVQRDSTDWAESVTSRDVLHPDVSTLGVRSSVFIAAGDTVVTVALPPAIIREWSEGVAPNNGILVLLRKPYYTPPILVGSRESSLPAELRVSYTSPPPGRF